MRRGRVFGYVAVGLLLIATVGCNFTPPIPTIPSITPPTIIPSTPTTTPVLPTTPTTPQLEIPTSEVDIYNKGFDWPPKDPADVVMTPTVIGFGWSLEENPEQIKYVHSYGARFISEISLWNNDLWRTLDDLPDDMKDAYVTDVDGNLMMNQEMVYLNLMHPAYREWQRYHVRNQIDLGTDGFVIDESEGATSAVWMGGGLDDYALAGFPAYLADIYDAAGLRGLGISTLEGFNYREYLRDKGLLDAYARGGFRDLPLGPDYYNYLYQETQNFIFELIDLARDYAKQQGREILITANFSPLYDSPRSQIDEQLDYFTFEHGFFDPSWRAEEPYRMVPYGVPVTPAIRYARSRDKDAVVLMGITDYGALAEIGEPTATRLVQHAFAETYANLGYFCYFDLDYGFIGNEYAADHARLRPYYAFLREHPEPFNDLQSRPRVAVVLPPHPTAQDFGPIGGTEGVAWVLSEINLDYAVVDVDQISDYDLAIVQGYAWSDAEVDQITDFMNSGGNVIAIDGRFASRDEDHNDVNRPEITALKKDGKHQVGTGSFTFFEDYIGWKYSALLDQDAFDQIAAAASGLAVPNSAPDGVQIIPYYDGDEIVIHCLNQNFSGTDFITQTELPIVVNLPDGFVISAATLQLASPDDAQVQSIPFTQEGNQLSFTLPSLYIWSTVSSK